MRVRVLGSAAGGGFPQWNCHCATCEAARAGERARPRTQSSLAIRGDDGPWFLVNASPDVREQLESLDAQGAGGDARARLRRCRRQARADGRVSRTADAGALLRRRMADARTGAAATARRLEPRGRAVRDGRRRAALSRPGHRARGERIRVQRLRRHRHICPRACQAGRRRGRSARRQRCRFRRRDVLARRRPRATGHLGPHGARHGPHAARRPRRDPRGARRARAPAQGARPHQQHEPDPAGGLPRAGAGRPGRRRSRLRWPRGRAVSKEFIARLRAQGARYHNLHPFHVRMDAGELTREELQRWVANRFYYQKSIPLKDAAILANCPEVEVRREWVQRIIDHDGSAEGTGGTESWLRLGEALGVSRDELTSERRVLPAVRYAVDGSVNFARQRPWVEAVASSLTELFGPAAMRVRLDALERHYPWIALAELEYYRTRLVQAPRDAQYALDVTVEHCRTREQQDAAVAALRFKTEVLWAQLDAIERGDTQPTGPGS